MKPKKPGTAAHWATLYEFAKLNGWTFERTFNLFKMQHGHYPSKDWPLVPVEELTLFRLVAHVPIDQIKETYESHSQTQTS